MATVFLTILKRRKREWSKGTSTPGERLDALSTVGEVEAFIKQAILQKRGARVGDAWNERWVCLTATQLYYGYYDETTNSSGSIIDRIPIQEVKNVVPEIEAADGAAHTHLEDESGNNGGSAPAERKARFIKNVESRRDLLAVSSASAFMIDTEEDGEKEGRKYRFQASSAEDMQDWIVAIFKARDNYTPEVISPYTHVRNYVKAMYLSTQFQILTAIAIFINFMCNAVEAELVPEAGSTSDSVLQTFDLIFVVLFTVELGINMFANLFIDFVSDGWNYFDTFVVIISLVATFADENPGLNVLRMVRAFRVFRLFRRLKSLGQIIRAINQSLPAVGNAFFLVLLMTSIYAIMGTSFFRVQYPQSFKSFSISMYTMFQIMTFDDSAEVTLEIMALQSNTIDTMGVALFTISFQLIVGFILLNIVMAVLLDKFTEASQVTKDDLLTTDALRRDMWHSIEPCHSNGDLIAPPFNDRSAYSTPIGWNRETLN